MADIDFEVNFKIYAFGSLTRSNILSYSQWAQLDFKFGQEKRLKRIHTVLYPLPSLLDGCVDNALTVPIKPTYFWKGLWLNCDANNPLKRYANADLLFNPSPSPNKTFQQFVQSIHGSNDAEIIDFPCLYGGGFLMESIGVYFGASYTLPKAYWGRLYMRFTFED